MTDLTTGGFPLTADTLATPPVHIPDGTGGTYKTELVLFRDPETATEKILWWHADDPRTEPHNHPWEFTSTILAGGYTDLRWWLDGGQLRHDVATFRAGDENYVPIYMYHSVTDVLPGTVTRMECGPAEPGNAWGYLDLETRQHIPATDPLFATEPPFIDQLRAINPHLRPKGAEQ